MSTRLGRDNESTPIKYYMPGCRAKRQDSGACTPGVEVACQKRKLVPSSLSRDYKNLNKHHSHPVGLLSNPQRLRSHDYE